MENISALIKACESGNISDAKDLLRQFDPSCLIEKKTREGRTCFYLAAFSGDTHLLGDLVEKLRDSDFKSIIKEADENGDTALHLAVRKDRIDMMKELVELDEKLCECTNKGGETPLKLAVSLGFEEAVELLLTRTRNALHYTVELNQIKFVESLLRRKVDLSQFIHQPYQPVTISSDEENCTTNPTNNQGNRATNSRHVQPIRGGEQYPTEEKKAEENKSPNSTETDDQPIVVIGDTPLHIAARNKYESMVYLLLEVHGVNKLALNSEYKTPLEIAREVIEYHESFMIIRKLGDFRGKPKRFMYCAPQVSHIKYKKAMSMLNKAYEERRNAELVVAALLAAMTCAALVNVPGGFNQESPLKELQESPCDEHNQGNPLLISVVQFKLFIIFDCIAFFLSLFVCIMWEMSSELTTRRKMRFMSVNSLLVCLSFGFSACGFMCAVYAMLSRKIKTFSWVVLGSLIFITLCGVLAFIHHFVHFVVKRARVQHLFGISSILDDIVERVWSRAEHCRLLKLCRSDDEGSLDFMTRHCKFKSRQGDDSSNSHSSPSCCFKHV